MGVHGRCYRQTALAIGAAGGLWLSLAVALLLQPAAARRSFAQAAVCLAPAQALAHEHQDGCIEGLVTGAFFAERSNGQPTFLDFGSSFTAVIWGEDRQKFTTPPESLRGRRIQVHGRISSFRGKAQIIVREPAQLAPAGSPPPVAATPTRPAVSSARAATPATEAAGAIGAATAPPPASPDAADRSDSTATPPRASVSTTAAGAGARTPAMAPPTAVAITAANVEREILAGSRSEHSPWQLVAAGAGLLAAGATGAAVYYARRASR